MRARAGSRPYVRCVAAAFTLVLLAAACSSGGDGDDAGTSATSANDGTKTNSTVGGDVTALEVDRTSRFSKVDTFCEPASGAPTATPKATDKGITANSIAITHIRVTLEDLRGARLRDPDR